jgi:tRNA (guanine-N7-)-methyltransferase
VLAMDDPSASNGKRLREILASDRQVEVEIGFGRGDFLLDRARRHPRTLFLGYETKTKATRLCLRRLERFQIENLWVSDDDCRFNIPRVVADDRVDALHILFPDPWWKPQHKVKRLFSPPFIDLVAAKLRSSGLLHFKSDVQEYGEFVRYLVEQHVGFDGHNPDLVDVLGEQALTHREHWCRQHHRPVYSYVFKRR